MSDWSIYQRKLESGLDRRFALPYGWLLLMICVGLFCQVSLSAQLEQLTQVERNQYTQEDHNGGTQTWDIQHLAEGHSFFANNDGLLHFDGVHWELYRTPMRTICRSIEFHAKDSLLYVGSQGEFGYFDLTRYPLEYTSLLDQIPKEHRKFSDVWDMVVLNEEIYFWSDQAIYSYNGDGFEVYPTDGKITFMSKVDGKIVFNQENSKLYTLVGDAFEPMAAPAAGRTLKLVDIIDLPGEGHLLLSARGGLYQYSSDGYRIWKNNSDGILRKALVRSGYYWQEKDLICIASSLSGVFLFDRNGVLRYQFSQDNGLANNTISALSGDNQNKLWLASYIDIAQVALDRRAGVLFPDRDLRGAVYDVAYWKGHYYFATSNGLYALEDREYYNPGKQKYFAIPGTEGECWGLDVVEDELFLAHNLGGFQVTENHEAIGVYRSAGVWKYLALTQKVMAMGAYDGIHLFKKNGEQWDYWRKVDSLSVSSRILVSLKEGELWMSHPYKGLFRILWSDDFSDQQVIPPENIHGLPEISNCYAFEFDDNLIVTNAGRIYAYYPDRDTFVLDENLNALFEQEKLVRLVPDGERYLYISDQTAGLLQIEQVGTNLDYRKKQIFPAENLFIGGYENLVHLKGHFFICSDRGAVLRQSGNKEVKIDLQVQRIDYRDSVLYSSLMKKNISQLNLQHDMQDIHVSLAVLSRNLFSEDLHLESVLRREDNDWSQVARGTDVHFQNLSPGYYVLDGTVLYENTVVDYPNLLTIKIPYPWYWTVVARVVYVVLFLAVLALLSYWPAYRERNAKKKLLMEKEKMDSQVLQLQEEKDHLELRAMEKELADSTMHLLQKTELLSGLRKELERVSRRVKDPVAKKELRLIENKLKDDKKLEEDWENFSKHFNRVHNDFLKRLKKAYPHLTPNDLKLCAYLRLNLRTKEIAPLLGISVRGVEVGRYRLRKKLHLDTNTNLNNFMISY